MRVSLTVTARTRAFLEMQALGVSSTAVLWCSQSACDVPLFSPLWALALRRQISVARQSISDLKPTHYFTAFFRAVSRLFSSKNKPFGHSLFCFITVRSLQVTPDGMSSAWITTLMDRLPP